MSLRFDGVMTNAPARSIDLAAKFDLFDRQWTPHRIARFDGHQLVLAKVEGEFVWHDHADHDEVFLPIDGVLLMDFENGHTVEVRPGEVLVVPKGTRHRPRTRDGECRVLLIDPLDVQHTGDEKTELTVDDYPEI
ncbi:MAG: cupin domain-containing protein [Planctomycetota bacterium]